MCGYRKFWCRRVACARTKGAFFDVRRKSCVSFRCCAFYCGGPPCFFFVWEWCCGWVLAPSLRWHISTTKYKAKQVDVKKQFFLVRVLYFNKSRLQQSGVGPPLARCVKRVFPAITTPERQQATHICNMAHNKRIGLTGSNATPNNNSLAEDLVPEVSDLSCVCLCACVQWWCALCGSFGV